MATTALRPRSVTEIVDAAFQILRAHYSQFVMCSAIAYLPWLVIQLLFFGSPERLMNTNGWYAMLAAVGVWLTFALMSAVIIGCASDAYLGEPVDVAASVRRALPRLPRVLLAAVLRYLLLFIGFLAMIVGALYVVARLFAIVPLIILEGAPVGQAIARSGELSRGRKRHILNTLGLVAIIYWAIAIGVMATAAVFGNFVIQAISSAFFTILAYPVIAITETLLYYDARIQSEGLDIELMAQELAGGTPAEPAAS